jgi:hypothetical protein
MDIITRSDAKKLGLTQYYTGKRCCNGHIEKRITSNGRCVRCSHISKRSGNSEYEKRYIKKWRMINRDKVNDSKRRDYIKHKDKRMETIRKYYNKNRELILAKLRADEGKRRRLAVYRKTEKHIIRRRFLAKEKSKDAKYNLSNRMRCRLWGSIRNKGGRSWEKLLGYSILDLMKHIESLFKDDMSWENIGKWHIDHIVPIASFNYSSTEDDDFKRCWSLNNLQPLWALENISKGARIDLSKTSAA